MNRLKLWRAHQIFKARERDEEFFMGLPDAWYNPATWGCINGHISSRFLKSEKHGNLCLTCQSPIFLIPRITEAELAEILSEDHQS